MVEESGFNVAADDSGTSSRSLGVTLSSLLWTIISRMSPTLSLIDARPKVEEVEILSL